ncbi:MAG: hypothetical protein MI919_22130, partial [Holophagales bacterium]|nr:hypothetical protein [Holophagales bacterium]
MTSSLDPARWAALCRGLGLEDLEEIFLRLQRSHGQRHRKYHNAQHVNDCLALLDASTHPAARDPLVEMAIWFHDAVYSTFSSRNEERSAEWARKVLVSAGSGAEAADSVASLILATRHAEPPVLPDHQLLVDIDLSILGASPERFRCFEEQIRAEFWWVPSKMYRKKRRSVLRAFADRRYIFATEEIRDRFESRAQANLEKAL